MRGVRLLRLRSFFPTHRERGNGLECGSRSCRFCMFERRQWHTKAAAAAAALQIGDAVCMAALCHAGPHPRNRRRNPSSRPSSAGVTVRSIESSSTFGSPRGPGVTR